MRKYTVPFLTCVALFSSVGFGATLMYRLDPKQAVNWKFQGIKTFSGFSSFCSMIDGHRPTIEELRAAKDAGLLPTWSSDGAAGYFSITPQPGSTPGNVTGDMYYMVMKPDGTETKVYSGRQTTTEYGIRCLKGTNVKAEADAGMTAADAAAVAAAAAAAQPAEQAGADGDDKDGKDGKKGKHVRKPDKK